MSDQEYYEIIRWRESTGNGKHKKWEHSLICSLKKKKIVITNKKVAQKRIDFVQNFIGLGRERNYERSIQEGIMQWP